MPYVKLDNPQSLNLYSYMGNNPLSSADSDGHGPNGGCLPGDAISANWSTGYDAAGDCFKAGAQQQAQQNIGQDPTLPTAIAPPTPSIADSVAGALMPKSYGDLVSMALMIPTDGLAEGGAALAKTVEMSSSIGEDSKLVKYAEDAGQSVQKGLDSLTKELSKGNTNPGLGTKSLGSGISYARARDGARVFFRQEGSQIEILAKASKANEAKVINYLKSLY